MRWFLIDRIVECNPGQKIRAVKCFSRSETIFQDHFSFAPIVPGVLQIEMVAQAIGKCMRAGDMNRIYALGAVKAAKFYRLIRPGSQCVIEAEIESATESYVRGKGRIFVDGERMSEIEVLCATLPKDISKNAKPDEVVVEWMESQKTSSHSVDLEGNA
jgi:3-hydroxyacyl-[acyl-carrier-protein] dehydratase